MLLCLGPNLDLELHIDSRKQAPKRHFQAKIHASPQTAEVGYPRLGPGRQASTQSTYRSSSSSGAAEAPKPAPGGSVHFSRRNRFGQRRGGGSGSGGTCNRGEGNLLGSRGTCNGIGVGGISQDRAFGRCWNGLEYRYFLCHHHSVSLFLLSFFSAIISFCSLFISLYIDRCTTNYIQVVH